MSPPCNRPPSDYRGRSPYRSRCSHSGCPRSRLPNDNDPASSEPSGHAEQDQGRRRRGPRKMLDRLERWRLAKVKEMAEKAHMAATLEAAEVTSSLAQLKINGVDPYDFKDLIDAVNDDTDHSYETDRKERGRSASPARDEKKKTEDDADDDIKPVYPRREYISPTERVRRLDRGRLPFQRTLRQRMEDEAAEMEESIKDMKSGNGPPLPMTKAERKMGDEEWHEPLRKYFEVPGVPEDYMRWYRQRQAAELAFHDMLTGADTDDED